MVSLLEVIDLTWLAFSCCRKKGLNGTLVRGVPEDPTASTKIQLIASSAMTNSQNPCQRCGGDGLCSSGVPRPSGAGATRQPRLSRGIDPDGGRSSALRGRAPLAAP